MICSQMAFAAYSNASLTVDSKYKLHLDSECKPLQNILTMILDSIHSSNSALPDFDINMLPTFSDDDISNPYEKFESIVKPILNTEKISSRLENTSENLSLTDLQNSDLSRYSLKFANLVLSSMSIDCDNNLELIAKTLLDMEGAFVTPDDLCYHVINLTAKGCIYRTK